MSWGLFPVLWQLLWSLVFLSHLLDCSVLSVSLFPGAELSPPISMPQIFVSLPFLAHCTLLWSL